MKDTTAFACDAPGTDSDVDRLDKGLTGQLALLAKMVCIFVGCAMWPFLVWWTLL